MPAYNEEIPNEEDEFSDFYSYYKDEDQEIQQLIDILSGQQSDNGSIMLQDSFESKQIKKDNKYQGNSIDYQIQNCFQQNKQGQQLQQNQHQNIHNNNKFMHKNKQLQNFKNLNNNNIAAIDQEQNQYDENNVNNQNIFEGSQENVQNLDSCFKELNILE
ncbi:hypothetical protein PPERSA_09652 [Pseudocohnilembus persalinus]|uniref:Uncharacterized protein n=1 Tax=Pseudocohnilembus persalinus TaxID=266149 RepID=A0A0V0R710_PSEPJ|nr:hypothetical protein PPERSA_09652 [Pseudocohnilembus persalinus]|eukprot:KRX10268.1 hypothetical protein PPERSA_09652 [Pseudocohnilembus persalinus]